MAESESRALTAGERQDLEQCEKEIGENLDSVFKLGKALLRVRDGELFREKFGTFAEYCDKRWNFTSRWGNKLIEAREVKDRVDRMAAQSSGTTVLQNEWQARELGKHPAEYQADIWATAQGLVKPAKGGGKLRAPTSADIARAAEQVLRGDSDDPPIEAESEEVVLKNGLGEDCAGWEGDYFMYADQRKEVVRLLTCACKEIGKLKDDPGMEAMNIPALLTVLKGFVLPHLRQSEPHAGCNECEGEGCDFCYNHGFKLRANFTKTADEEATDGERKFLAIFEKDAPADLPRHEVKRRLGAHVAHKRLTRPTKAMLKEEKT